MPQTNKQTWSEIQDGYGLELVPDDLKRDLCCSICGEAKKLYTAHSVQVPVDPAAGFEKWRKSRSDLISRIRGEVFCKSHAMWYYQDAE